MAPRQKPDASYASLLQNFTDFLTVAIHTILAHRNVYPPESFITTRKYNHPVYQSRHPELCSWITSAVDALKTELLLGHVSKVAIVIMSPYSDPLERFVFDCKNFPFVQKGNYYLPLVRGGEEGPGVGGVPDIKVINVDMEEQFRGVFARLSTCNASLKALPEECSFTVALELRESAVPPIRHPQPWMPTEPDLQQQRVSSGSSPGAGSPGMEEFEELERFGGSGDGDGDEDDNEEEKIGGKLGGVRTVPVRTVGAGEMRFEMWIEEGGGKDEALRMDREDRGLESTQEEEEADDYSDQDVTDSEL
ncbi:DNA-binding protein [Tothia fuscella]|uniref:DNA-binding protein n=1 Tax=Tothia fuscella TaxID=1048955 RepID=A0A9P4NMT0_9PEZI|nr:DNA-binding protein [Tothia fuscella]